MRKDEPAYDLYLEQQLIGSDHLKTPEPTAFSDITEIFCGAGHGAADSPKAPRDSAPARLAIGRQLGKCLLTEVLGQGGWCTVYRGLHQTLEIPVAVKVLDLDPEDPYFPCARQQLHLEARLLARFNHPNIVRSFDFVDDDRLPYLVLECVDGANLKELIQQSGCLQADKAKVMIRQVVDGLAAMWSKGVVHRDMKPANILLDKDGVPKIADLGQAALLEASAKHITAEQDRSDEMAGTVAYLAPEQFLNPQTVDHRADLYALGVTFYEAVTGQLPFEGRSRMEVLLKHAHEPPVSPRRLVPELDGSVSDVILKLLAKDPNDRFGSQEELQAALADPVTHPSLPKPRQPVNQDTATIPLPKKQAFWQSLMDSFRSRWLAKPRSQELWLQAMKKTLLASNGDDRFRSIPEERQ